jgi:hypothetical protein
VWLSGEPLIDATVNAPLPGATLVADLYDVDGGDATLISRGADLLRGSGRQRATFALYGQDWLVRKGHRIGVLLSGSNREWWVHVPTGATVDVSSAKVGLPFLTYERVAFIDGRATPRLESYLADAVVTVAPSTVRARTKVFRLPGALKAR